MKGERGLGERSPLTPRGSRVLPPHKNRKVRFREREVRSAYGGTERISACHWTEQKLE